MEAPMGFRWGEQLVGDTIAQQQAQATNKDGRLSFVKLGSAPRPLSETQTITAIIDDIFGLQKLIWSGCQTDNDALGSNGKSKYARLKDMLSRKYGLPENSYEYSGCDVYTEADEFYQCLAYDGCGKWVSFWPDRGGMKFIVLELLGLDRGAGYVQITFEGPQWYDALAEIEKLKDAEDFDAL